MDGGRERKRLTGPLAFGRMLAMMRAVDGGMRDGGEEGRVDGPDEGILSERVRAWALAQPLNFLQSVGFRPMSRHPAEEVEQNANRS